jgi:hypothetical protein
LQPPDVRLAWFDIPAVNETLNAPAVRLAQNGARMEQHARNGELGFQNSGLGPAPAVLLAHQPGSQCDNSTKEGGWNGNGAPVAPALLVSFVYVKPFLENRPLYRYRDWVMDSGAFSAHNSGTKIELSRYVDCCLDLMATDPSLTEVFSLDVIPKDKQALTLQRAAEESLKNCEEMWRQGVPAIPTFHLGEDESFLMEMAKAYPKIGIGGVAMLRGGLKFRFCEQVFARVWPKRIHGLGMASTELVYGLPFHSVDATNWELAPCAFGNWMKFGSMSVRGSNQDLRSQVKHYLEVEAKARVRWAKEMLLLDAMDADPATSWHDKVKVAAGMRAAGMRAAVIGRPVSQPVPEPVKVKQPKEPKAPKEPKPEKVAAAPVAMEDKWVDYWKNRL